MAGPPDWDLRESDVYVHLIQAVLWRALFVQRGASLAPPSLQPAVSSDAALGDSSALSSAKRKMARRSIAPLPGVFTPTALFKSNRVKGSKLPERLTKRFGDRFADVINGTDLAYRDPAFRNTMAAFSIRYSSRDFQKGFGKKRSIEDLVLLFTAQAQDCMATEAPDTELHQQVNEQVRLFIHLLRDTVAARLGARNYFASSHDLLVRLDSYLRQMDELGAARPHKNLASLPDTLSDASSTATAKVNPLSFASTILTLPAVKLVEVQPLLLTVARLTNTELAQLLKDIDGIRLHWAPKAILSTLKRAHEDVKLKDFNCGNEANFDNYEAWKTWATGEQKDLSERINALYESCPELLQMSTDAARDRHSAVAGEASTASVVPGGEICLIPERSEWVYRCVVQMCFERDLQNIASQAEDEVVELTILSKAHVDLLAQAAEVWRVRKPFSRIMHLQIALDQLSKADRPSTIPAVCVEAILERVEGTVKNEPMSLWTTKEQRLMNETLLHTMRCALTELSFQLHELRTLDLQGVLGWAELVDHIHVDLLDHSTESCGILNSGVDALKDLIRCQGVREYDAIAAEVLAQSPDSLVVVRLHQVCVWLTQRVRKLTKQFPQPLLCRSLNIASLVSEKQVSRFWSEMKRRRSEVLDLALHEQEVISFGHLFQLYDDVVLLRETLAKTCTDMPWGLDVPEWFQPHVDQWLVCTSQKTAEWVDNAVRIDTFEPIDSVGAFHSSSIDDLFAALQQPVDFLNGLCWPDGYSLAGFKTSLAKIVSRAIQQYCARIQGMFMTEVLARLPGASKTEAQKQHRVWIARAKQALREKTKVEPFVLQPTTCIKLNNIEKARQLLDTLYNKMDADSHSRIASQHTFDPKGPLVKLPVTEGTKEPQRYLFTVKVIQADGLLPVGIATEANALDSFVVLTNEKTQTHYARTRTAYDTCEPRWDESFDVTVETPIWLTLTVMERRSGNEEAAFGRTTIKLDPVEFRLMGTQSKVLELDTQGSLLVRIGAEAQHEDILYHFGLAFRSLKRCESNMVHTIVDRIAVFIRQCLSQSTVKSFVRTSTPMGQRLDRMKNLASTSWTAAANGNSETPVASEDAMFVKARTKGVEWTDEEIEQAISPLFVYFESVLATLNESLSPDERLLVLSKIWKQVLMTLQSILMPPLSDKPTDMRPLDERHVAVVMKWRLFLFDYFLARDEETDEVYGLPVDVLRTVKYRELDEFAALNAMTTETLKLEYSRVVGCSRQKQASAHGAERFKSVIHQRSLGTVKERKAQKNFLNDFSTEVVILRILRMRPGTQEFLSQQLSRRPGATAALTPHKESSTSHLGRKLQAKGHQLTASLPQLPSVATMMGTQPSSSPLLGATHGSTPGPSAGYSSARHATGLPLSHARVRSSADPRPPPPPLPLPPRDGHVGERARPALRGARTAPRAPPPLPPRS